MYMYTVVSYKNGKRHITTRHMAWAGAKTEFERRSAHCQKHKKTSVTAIKIHDSSEAAVMEWTPSWILRRPSEFAEDLPPVRRPFKIHSLNHVNGKTHQSNSHFYETEGEALDRCASYVQQGNDAMVLFRAYRIVRPSYAPVQIVDAMTGEVVDA